MHTQSRQCRVLHPIEPINLKVSSVIKSCRFEERVNIQCKSASVSLNLVTSDANSLQTIASDTGNNTVVLHRTRRKVSVVASEFELASAKLNHNGGSTEELGIGDAEGLPRVDVTRGTPVHCPAVDERLVQYLSVDLSVSPARVKALLVKWPPVEQLDFEYISSAIHKVAALMRCRPVDAAQCIAQEHRLLHSAPANLQQNVMYLCKGLQVQPPSVMGIARQEPQILFQQPADVITNAEQVANCLNVTTQQLVSAALIRPWLLRAPPDTIASRVRHLKQTLGLEPGQSLLTHPELVYHSSNRIDGMVGCLQRCLQYEPKQARQVVASCPQLVNFTQQNMQNRVQSLSQQIPLAALQHMVQQEPSILARDADRIKRSLLHLQQLLKCPREAALHLVVRRPSLVTRTQESIKGSFKALSIWKMPPDFKKAVIGNNPVLLRMSSQEVHGRCRWLRDLVLRNGYYHSALRRLTPKLLGIVILHLPTAWSRLQYLIESSQEGGTELMSVVQASRSAFVKSHPGYLKWLQWKCVEQGCLIPWRSDDFLKEYYTWRPRSASERQAQVQGDGLLLSRQHLTVHNSSQQQAPEGVVDQMWNDLLHQPQQHRSRRIRHTNIDGVATDMQASAVRRKLQQHTDSLQDEGYQEKSAGQSRVPAWRLEQYDDADLTDLGADQEHVQQVVTGSTATTTTDPRSGLSEPSMLVMNCQVVHRPKRVVSKTGRPSVNANSMPDARQHETSNLRDNEAAVVL